MSYDFEPDPRWWLYPENLKEVSAAGEILLKKKHADHSLVFIGQSCAWIREARHMHAEKHGLEINDRLIAFSGGDFLRPNAFVFAPTKDCPSYEQRLHYRAYLERDGISPAGLIDSAQRLGKKTYFCDYVNNGTGVASFLYLLGEWAKEQNCRDDLEQSIEWRAFRSNPEVHHTFLLAHATNPAPVFTTFKKTYLQVDFATAINFVRPPHMVYVTLGKPKKDKGADRSVAYYPPGQWHKLPQEITGEKVAEIRRRLRDFIFSEPSAREDLRTQITKQHNVLAALA